MPQAESGAWGSDMKALPRVPRGGSSRTWPTNSNAPERARGERAGFAAPPQRAGRISTYVASHAEDAGIRDLSVGVFASMRGLRRGSSGSRAAGVYPDAPLAAASTETLCKRLGRTCAPARLENRRRPAGITALPRRVPAKRTVVVLDGHERPEIDGCAAVIMGSSTNGAAIDPGWELAALSS